MAEVVAGLLASAFVSIVKDKLGSAIADQANMLWNFGVDLENMMDVFETISAVLEDAERRSVKEKLVRLWLKRLKDVASDISDMLEDYQDTSDQTTAKVRRACLICTLKQTYLFTTLPVIDAFGWCCGTYLGYNTKERVYRDMVKNKFSLV